MGQLCNAVNQDLNADFGAHIHDIVTIQKWVRGHSARLQAEVIRNDISNAIE
jgi:hypothetical protein